MIFDIWNLISFIKYDMKVWSFKNMSTYDKSNKKIFLWVQILPNGHMQNVKARFCKLIITL